MNKWFYLTFAILSEVIATSALKSTEGFTKLWPSIIVLVGYSVAFYFLSLTLDTIPIGVVSKSPAFTNGSAWNAGEGRFLRDEWNACVLNNDGEQVENPNYDHTMKYIPREERPEWVAVGLVGKLPMQKDYITDSIRNNTNWIKMSDINDNVERWLVK